MCADSTPNLKNNTWAYTVFVVTSVRSPWPVVGESALGRGLQRLVYAPSDSHRPGRRMEKGPSHLGQVKEGPL